MAKKRIISWFLAVVIAAAGLVIPASAATKTEERYDRRMAQLVRLLERDEYAMEAVGKNGDAVAFLSVSDGTSRAVTVYAKTGSLTASLDKVLNKAKETGIYPKWLKLDVVTETEEISYDEFREKYTAGKRGGSFRKGIAFNDYFGRALLDSQLNSGGFVSYETGELDLEKINTYFRENQKKQLEKIPDTLYLFETRGYFTDGHAYRLLDGSANTTGRRDFSTDPEGLLELATMSSGYLSGLTEPSGEFIYGYYPINDEEIGGYSIIRHAGTIWNMVLQYDMTRDEALLQS
ncbi:MAG: hypothetical protein K2N29_07765, partial [Ruminiclostridium sp.]|nr:hypothetical protein [Ruminiclostridium sp.]